MARPTVVVTRDEGADGPLSSALFTRGARVVSYPTIAIQAPQDPAPLDEALADLSRYDWLVFTSAHAVEAACTRPAWSQAWSRSSTRPRVAAVGATTSAALARFGLAAVLAAQGRPRVLWPRSNIARPELPEALRRAGASLTAPVAYRTVPEGAERAAAILRLLEAGAIDAFAFMSPSSARNLAAALERGDLRMLSGRVVVASIGPTTTTALRALGAPPDVEASERTAEGLAACLMSCLTARKGVVP